SSNEEVLAGRGDERVVLGVAEVAEVELKADVGFGGVAQGNEFAYSAAGLDGEQGVGGCGVALLDAGDSGADLSGCADGEVDAGELLLERGNWGGGVLSECLGCWEAEEA